MRTNSGICWLLGPQLLKLVCLLAAANSNSSKVFGGGGGGGCAGEYSSHWREAPDRPAATGPVV